MVIVCGVTTPLVVLAAGSSNPLSCECQHHSGRPGALKQVCRAEVLVATWGAALTPRQGIMRLPASLLLDLT